MFEERDRAAHHKELDQDHSHSQLSNSLSMTQLKASLLTGCLLGSLALALAQHEGPTCESQVRGLRNDEKLVSSQVFFRGDVQFYIETDCEEASKTEMIELSKRLMNSAQDLLSDQVSRDNGRGDIQALGLAYESGTCDSSEIDSLSIKQGGTIHLCYVTEMTKEDREALEQREENLEKQLDGLRETHRLEKSQLEAKIEEKLEEYDAQKRNMEEEQKKDEKELKESRGHSLTKADREILEKLHKSEEENYEKEGELLNLKLERMRARLFAQHEEEVGEIKKALNRLRQEGIAVDVPYDAVETVGVEIVSSDARMALREYSDGLEAALGRVFGKQKFNSCWNRGPSISVNVRAVATEAEASQFESNNCQSVSQASQI